MKSLTVGVCSLLAAAFALPAQPPNAPANLDHFNCYTAPGHIQPQLAFLQDQFDARDKTHEIIQDLRMLLFCNPTQKTVISSTFIPPVPILHPADHLAMYVIPPEPTILRSVTVQNQFGTQSLITGRAVILAVPSGKAPVAATVPSVLPPIPSPKELDHFKCYTASGQPLNAAVQLKDQFFPNGFGTRLLHPILFCNPVEKIVVTPGNPNANGAPAQVNVSETVINNPTAHLTCYLEVPTPFKGVVIYNNQFVPAGTLPTVALQNAEILCVPSLKSEDWTEITNPPGTVIGGN